MSISGSVVALSRGSSGAQGVGEEGRERGLAVVGTKGHNLLGSGYEWLQQIDQEGFPLSMKTYEISLNATPAILQKNLIGAINQGGTDLVLTNHSDLALFLDPVHSNSSITNSHLQENSLDYLLLLDMARYVEDFVIL